MSYDRCRDGDTIVVRVNGSAFTWAVRLIDCWCPELRAPKGYAAKKYVEEILQQIDPSELRLFIPAPSSANLLRELLSFDRVLGHIFISPTQSLNELLVQFGYASSTKTGELGQ